MAILKYKTPDGKWYPLDLVGESNPGVEWYVNKASFPTVGEQETLYIDSSTFFIYIWNGSDYTLANANDPTVCWNGISN